MSGNIAREYVTSHLESARTDGMGRSVHRCPDTGIEWAEDARADAYADEAIVVRRVTR